MLFYGFFRNVFAEFQQQLQMRGENDCQVLLMQDPTRLVGQFSIMSKSKIDDGKERTSCM
jgi:hypothetical protein